MPKHTKTNFLCDISWLLDTSNGAPPPNWSGFMQTVSVGLHNPKSEIKMLPIIDLNSSDYNCTYSTLLFIKQQAPKLNIITPCIVFDQPLWLKAIEVVEQMSQKLLLV